MSDTAPTPAPPLCDCDCHKDSSDPAPALCDCNCYDDVGADTVSPSGGESLGTKLPQELTRVRDEVLPAYLDVGPPGAFAVAMIRADLDAASKAMIEGDVVAMLRCYEKLKGTST